MNAIYRDCEIRITREPTEAHFIVLHPNGTKLTSGFFSLSESLVKKYQELQNRIDMELIE